MDNLDDLIPNLKPCPFCGCHGADLNWHYGYWSVKCGYWQDVGENPCGQEWGEFETEVDAIDAWNKRAEVDR